MVNKLRTDVHIDSKNDFLRKLIKPIKFYNQVLGNSLKSNSNMIQRKKKIKNKSKRKKKIKQLSQKNIDLKDNIRNYISNRREKKFTISIRSENSLPKINSKESLVKRKIKFKKENKVNENNKLNSISKKNLKKFSKENSLYINKQNEINNNNNEKKYKIPYIFKSLLGLKQDTFLTLNEFNELFKKLMIKSGFYDSQNGYFLVYYNKELANIFKQEIIKQCDIKYFLEELLIKSNLKQTQDIPVNIKHTDLSSDDESCRNADKSENQFKQLSSEGWNINDEQTYMIDYTNIHSSNFIFRRDFFSRDMDILQFRFKENSDKCFE